MRIGSPGDSSPESHVVGISSGVVDPRRARGGLDGIGTYTEALLAHVSARVLRSNASTLRMCPGAASRSRPPITG
jgi:hypothetical protein